MNAIFVTLFILVILPMLAGINVLKNSRYYNKIKQQDLKISSPGNRTARDVAKSILKQENITDVEVESMSGNSLNAQYNYTEQKRIEITEKLENLPSLTSVAIAAHECGHAWQHLHQDQLLILKLLNWKITFWTIAGWKTRCLIILIFISTVWSLIYQKGDSLLLLRNRLTIVMIASYVVTLFSSAVYLWFERDASEKAMHWIRQMSLLEPSSFDKAEEILLKALLKNYIAKDLLFLCSPIIISLIPFLPNIR